MLTWKRNAHKNYHFYSSCIALQMEISIWVMKSLMKYSSESHLSYTSISIFFYQSASEFAFCFVYNIDWWFSALVDEWGAWGHVHIMYPWDISSMSSWSTLVHYKLASLAYVLCYSCCYNFMVLQRSSSFSILVTSVLEIVLAWWDVALFIMRHLYLVHGTY